MITTHKYMMKSHGSNTSVERQVQVEWPSIEEAIVRIGRERVEKIFYGFIAAHHIQGRLKSAYLAEKPDDEQTTLMHMVAAGKTLDGLSFVPKERKAKEERDPVVLRLMELDAAGELVEEKVVSLMARWNIEGAWEEQDVESLIAGYKAYLAKAREI